MLFFQRYFWSAPALLIAAALAGCSSGGATPSAGIQNVPLSVARVGASAPQFSATALPAGFIPVAIMKDGAIPGRIGHHAGIFRNGKLTMLPDFPACTTALKSGGLVTATSSNVHGVVVGFCNSPNTTPIVGYALYYRNGSVQSLPYPISYPEIGSVVISMAINDLGVIVGAVNTPGMDGSGLYELHTNGTEGTFFAPTWDYNDPINDNGKLADTQFNLSNCCFASIVGINGSNKIITERPASLSKWINDNGLVVGSAGPQAYVYAGGHITYLPAPATEATGVNDTNAVIGDGKSGIFLYANGVETTIEQDITPAGKYRVEYLNAATGYQYLGGLSDSGAFVATTGFDQFFLVTPVTPLSAR